MLDCMWCMRKESKDDTCLKHPPCSLSMWLDASRCLVPGCGLQGQYEGICFGYVKYGIPIKRMGQLAMLEIMEIYAI